VVVAMSHEAAIDEAGHWEECHACHSEALEYEPGCAECSDELDERYRQWMRGERA
jgi:hypothetical protein